MDQSYSLAEQDNVRFIQQLRIRIGEAKNLQPRNGTAFLKDCFCVIRLDREEIFRTHCSSDRTQSPFFGEEFYFDIPRIFRFLSIYLYERERSVNTIRNRPLGKVIIGQNYLQRFNSEESWFPLLPINHESEIQGKICLLVEPQYILNSNCLRIITCVYECKDISEECCDSFFLLNLKIFNDLYTKRSKVKKKTLNPHFDETFSFEIPLDKYSNLSGDSHLILDSLLANSELRIAVQDSKTCSKLSTFLGEVRIPLNRFQINGTHKAWYYLQPQVVSDKLQPNLGSLRLRIHYVSDYVFSSHFYDSLRNLLLSSLETKPVTSSIAHLLGEFVLNKAEAAQPLVKICLHYKKLVSLIKFLAEDEISKITDVNTIFRGNSLVSKCIDELMKLVGIRYLHDTLKGCIEAVISENKCCEIDPSRIKENDSLEANMNNLKAYASLFFNVITSSAARCPQIMCDVFCVLKQLAVQFFPTNKDVNYYVISGFVFLRFFAPSILNPRLFELTDKNINCHVNRTFTLISKTIQSIGNLVVSKKNTPIIKENYMMTFYKDFINESHIIRTKEFLEAISSTCRVITKEPCEPVILKESIMFKKSKYKRIGFGTTYKKRYFCITTQHFFCAKTKNKTPLFRLPISEITVKKLADNYPLKNMFQVIHNKCTLHIQASNCVQEREWLDTLSRLIQLNQNSASCRVSSFGGSVDSSKNHITADLSIRLDPDRELERIHSLFVTSLESLQLIADSCAANKETVKIWKGNCKSYPSQFVIEDASSLLPIIRALQECVTQLEHNHQTYLSSIIGSEVSPIDIGD